MPAPLPTTEIYAFATPVVKAGGVDELGVVVRVSGGRHGLRAPRSVWRDLYKKLEVFFVLGEPLPEVVAQKAHSHGHRPRAYNRARLTDAQHAACRAGVVDWLAGKFEKQRDAASAHGVSYYTFVEWFRRHRDEFPAEGRQPVTKPSGEIL